MKLSLATAQADETQIINDARELRQRRVLAERRLLEDRHVSLPVQLFFTEAPQIPAHRVVLCLERR